MSSRVLNHRWARALNDVPSDTAFDMSDVVRHAGFVFCGFKMDTN